MTREKIVAGIIIAVLMAGAGVFAIKRQSAAPARDNKSLTRHDTYDVEYDRNNCVFNVSVDDTIRLFEDLYVNAEDYNTIFQNDTLNWARSIHEKYGTCFSFFVYYEDGDFCLDQMSDQYRDEFQNNSEWLRFGFHALDSDSLYDDGKGYDISEDYRKTMTSLIHIVGEEAVDNVTRLHRYAGTLNDVQQLADSSVEPVVGLYTADDKRTSYCLTDKDSDYMYSHDRMRDDSIPMWFFSTDLRLEYIEDISVKIKEFETSAWNNQMDDLIVFTHECMIEKEEVKEKAETLCDYACQNGYLNIFLEDILMTETTNGGS